MSGYYRLARSAKWWVLVAGALLGSLLSSARASAYERMWYRGGDILETPEIAPVYLGPWAPQDIANTQAYIAALVDYLNGKGAPRGRQNVLRQYGIRGASLLPPAGPFPVPAQYQTAINDKDAAKNLIAQAQQMPGVYHYAPGRIVLVMTGGVPNVSLEGKVAFHGDDGDDSIFAFVPTELNSSTAGLQTSISHEIFEAATDPHPTNSIWGQGWIYWEWQFCATVCLDPFNWACDTECFGHTDEGADACGNTTQQLPFGTVTNFADNARMTCDVWSPAAQPVAGDFDGDGVGDIALVGGYRVIGDGHAPYDSVAIAYSNGSGFPRSTVRTSDYMWFADVDHVTALGGDFNGDGYGDIAFVGGIGWWTTPIAFSNGDGTFQMVNSGDAQFAAWAQLPGVQVVSGDFNGDQKTDIALAGGPGWTTVPMAFSNGDGTFYVDNYGAGLELYFAQAMSAPGVQLVAGRFDGSGQANLAAVGRAGEPIAYLKYTSSIWNIGALHDLQFAGWSALPGVRATAGDFDGNGYDDIALSGGPGWASVPIGFVKPDSSGIPTLHVQNVIQLDFGVWATLPGAQPLAVHLLPYTNQAQIALVGGWDWQTIPYDFLAAYPYSQWAPYDQMRWVWNTGVQDNASFPNYWQ